MVFALETEMIPIIEAQLGTVLGHPRSFAKATELPVNHRVVDLAAAVIDPAHVDDSSQVLRSLSKFSMQQLDVLALFCSKDFVSIQYLCRKTFLSSTTIHRTFLDRFITCGLVSRHSRYTYSTTGWTEALPAQIVAIEAKLVRWQEVLAQAIHNHVFADVSYAALDVDQFPATRSCLQCFREAGVGLLSVNDQGQVDVVARPKRMMRHGRDRLFQAIRVVRDLQLKHRSSKWQMGQ